MNKRQSWRQSWRQVSKHRRTTDVVLRFGMVASRRGRVEATARWDRCGTALLISIGSATTLSLAVRFLKSSTHGVQRQSGDPFRWIERCICSNRRRQTDHFGGQDGAQTSGKAQGSIERCDVATCRGATDSLVEQNPEVEKRQEAALVATPVKALSGQQREGRSDGDIETATREGKASEGWRRRGKQGTSVSGWKHGEPHGR